METKDIIWLVSEISALLGEGLATTQGDLYVWVSKGEIVLDVNNKEIQFIDSELDLKTQYALIGLASLRGLTTGDYFRN